MLQRTFHVVVSHVSSRGMVKAEAGPASEDARPAFSLTAHELAALVLKNTDCLA